MAKQFMALTALTALIGCMQATGASKEDFRDAPSKADGIDWCDEYGWYDDGVCDDFCLMPDPECGPTECNVDPRAVFCSDGTFFNTESCQCEAAAICPAIACPPGQDKNIFTCACEGDIEPECNVDPRAVLCGAGTFFNVDSCQCEAAAICPAIACPTGQDKNIFTCACEGDIEPECNVDPRAVFCSDGTFFNIDSCQCDVPANCFPLACLPGQDQNIFTCNCE